MERSKKQDEWLQSEIYVPLISWKAPWDLSLIHIFLAICGENGAGKSTLMKVLSGTYTNKDYEGEIWIDGTKREFTSVHVAEECGIEMVYQELNMMLDSSIAENIFVGNLPGKVGFVD